MHPLYILLAFAGILGGGVMIGSGLGMQLQGAIAILTGVLALAIGIHTRGKSESAEPAAPTVDRGGPWTPEDNMNDRIVYPASGISLFKLKNQVDAVPDGSGFVVGYGDYISPIMITDDIHRLPRGRQLALALEATPGADAAEPKRVDHQNVSGSLEDDFVRYECWLPLSPANVLALKATEFKWTNAALQLGKRFEPAEEAIESVLKKIFELAKRDVLEDRF